MTLCTIPGNINAAIIIVVISYGWADITCLLITQHAYWSRKMPIDHAEFIRKWQCYEDAYLWNGGSSRLLAWVGITVSWKVSTCTIPRYLFIFMITCSDKRVWKWWRNAGYGPFSQMWSHRSISKALKRSTVEGVGLPKDSRQHSW